MALFSERERQVYSCPHLKRAFDPLAVKRALTIATRDRFNILCQEAKDENKAKAGQAQALLIAAARSAFSLPPIAADGSGVLDAVAYDALIAFCAWLLGKEPRAKQTQQASPSTASPLPAHTTPGSP